MQPVGACALFHVLFPAASPAGPLSSLACLLAGNGVLALIVRAKASPLPFRWEDSWPAGPPGARSVVTCTSAVMRSPAAAATCMETWLQSCIQGQCRR